MQNPAPDQRAIVVRILTSAGFVEGTLRVPRRTCLADAWDHAPEFVPLTDVQVPGLPARVPFFAIRRHEMMLLIPPATETLIVQPRSQEVDHAMSALLPGQFAIGGTVAVLHDVRLTDHLRRPSTLVLKDATIIGPGVHEQQAVVLVDPQRVLGISEQ